MRWVKPAAAGMVAGGITLGVAELASGLLGRAVSPTLVVGAAAVDRTPRFLKEFAIRTFGENDKTVLLAGVLITVLLLAAVLGVLASRRPAIGLTGVGLLGVVAAGAALTRPNAQPVDVLPSLVGATLGAAALVVLLGRDATGLPGSTGRPAAGSSGRRELLLFGAGMAAAAASGLSGRTLLSRRADVAASRRSLVLPRAVDPAPTVPAGATLGVPGMQPLFTPGKDFYRVDTALSVPRLTTKEWRLRIHGRVERELDLDFGELIRRPIVERDITLTCVSNEVGGPLLGTARWLGVELAPLLAEAGVRPGATQLVSRSVDGMTIGTPVAAVTDGRAAMLAIAMNGEPLLPEHGFPVRMIVPGLYGYVSATKWLVDLELSTFEDFEAYWVERGWVEKAPIKISSRIDTPRAGAAVPPGKVAVAGVAWAQRRGISAVEVRVDGGRWGPARLADAVNSDVWRQWVYEWDAEPGGHTLQVRARDGGGRVQEERRTAPFPSGSTGWQSLFVTVKG